MNSNQQKLRVNSERLWSSLMDMGAIGATENGGCNRQALTDLDKSGRDLFVSWCEQAGCHFRIDEIGNIFVRREGKNPDLAPVLVGSHLDTQPTGGKFDGVYGVLAGVELLRVLEENQIVTDHPVEVVVWTNEEGARFAPAMMASGVWSGVFELEDIYQVRDKSGLTVKEELERLGYKGESRAKAFPVKAAFEVHIEQGPILESSDLQIGVVTGAQGVRWYDLVINGKPCHAGPTPMEDRLDPFSVLSPVLQKCYALASEYSPWGRATIGDIVAEPGSRNTVPEKLTVNIDLRHPDAHVLAQMDKEFREAVANESAARGMTSDVREVWHMPVTAFDPECVSVVRRVTERLGYSYMDMVSGAGHDSVYIAKVAPTSMIFIPCEDGISHNEAENAKPSDVEAGANVLLHSVLDMACVT